MSLEIFGSLKFHNQTDMDIKYCSVTPVKIQHKKWGPQGYEI